MALYLVGENIDKARSHYQSETGKLVQLMRGIYVDADDEVDAMVLRHAVRIARYLYPKAYLSAASAILMGSTRDGRLFLSARRSQLNGKDDRLQRADFRVLASTAGLRAADTERAIDDMIARMKPAADEVALPKLPDYGPQGEAMAAKMLDICRMRIKTFA